jgi:hypothetical protein
MNRDDDSGPCPRCGGPSKCVDYDEAPWGARGNYTYGCEKCGEFYEVPQDVTKQTPLEYRFRNDVDASGPGPAGVQFSDKAIPSAVAVTIRIVEGFQPGELHLREFTSIKTKLPAGAKVLSEMSSNPAPPVFHVVDTKDGVELLHVDMDVLPIEPTPSTFEPLLLSKEMLIGKAGSPLPMELKEPKRCLRCGRLEETCDSGLYGDCIDYRR